MFPACLDHPHTRALLARRIAAACPRGHGDRPALLRDGDADAAAIPETPTERAA